MRWRMPTSRNDADAFDLKEFPEFFPLEAMHILDAGRTYAGGNPPQSIQLGEKVYRILPATIRP